MTNTPTTERSCSRQVPHPPHDHQTPRFDGSADPGLHYWHCPGVTVTAPSTHLTVQSLYTLLEEALLRGLPPETAVTVETPTGFQTVRYLGDPSSPDTREAAFDMWFTLQPDAHADSRTTPGGMPS